MKLSKDDVKRLRWLEDHIRGFKDCHEQVVAKDKEEEANRKAMLPKEKAA